jgi:hypothetical protein
MNKRDQQRLQNAARKARLAHWDRDQIIGELHPRDTIRTIATVAGLSPARVGQIVRERRELEKR